MIGLQKFPKLPQLSLGLIIISVAISFVCVGLIHSDPL